MKKFIDAIVNRIKDIKDNIKRFTIQSDYIFGDIFINIHEGRKISKFKFHEYFHKDMNSYSIERCLKDLKNGMFYRYFHIREYANGIYVYFSNDGDVSYSENLDRGYRDITIPVKNNYKSIEKLLNNLLFAHELYRDYIMDDIEADLSKNSLVIGSAGYELSVEINKMAAAIEYDDVDKYDAYILSKTKGIKNWFSFRPLSLMAINDWDDGVIITNEQLKENILPPVEFFDISIPGVA